MTKNPATATTRIRNSHLASDMGSAEIRNGAISPQWGHSERPRPSSPPQDGQGVDLEPGSSCRITQNSRGRRWRAGSIAQPRQRKINAPPSTRRRSGRASEFWGQRVLGTVYLTKIEISILSPELPKIRRACAGSGAMKRLGEAMLEKTFRTALPGALMAIMGGLSSRTSVGRHVLQPPDGMISLPESRRWQPLESRSLTVQ